MLTSLFIKGLLVGFLIAAPVGPVNVMCVRRTIMHGRLVGLVSGMGAATADTIFGAIAAFGLSFVYEMMMTERFWLGLGGGVLLLLVIVLMTLWRGVQRFRWRRDMGRQVQWLYLLVGLGLFPLLGLHGTLGAELAAEFGVHVTADQLLAAGVDLRQALPPATSRGCCAS